MCARQTRDALGHLRSVSLNAPITKLGELLSETACLRSTALRGYHVRGIDMTSEADADQALLRRIRAGEQHALGELFARIASDSAGWCSYGWTGACKGGSTPPT